jgi:hypothetical protein
MPGRVDSLASSEPIRGGKVARCWLGGTSSEGGGSLSWSSGAGRGQATVVVVRDEPGIWVSAPLAELISQVVDQV